MTAGRPERRAVSPRPAQWCPYCGTERGTHDRLADEWQTCADKAAFFAEAVPA